MLWSNSCLMVHWNCFVCVSCCCALSAPAWGHSAGHTGSHWTSFLHSLHSLLCRQLPFCIFTACFLLLLSQNVETGFRIFRKLYLYVWVFFYTPNEILEINNLMKKIIKKNFYTFFLYCNKHVISDICYVRLSFLTLLNLPGKKQYPLDEWRQPLDLRLWEIINS